MPWRPKCWPGALPACPLRCWAAATAACWLAAGHTTYDRLILYASVFPPELDRQATLARLPKRPVTLVATTADVFTPEAAAEGLLHDLHEAGLPAQLRYVSEGPLPLASLGAFGEGVS